MAGVSFVAGSSYPLPLQIIHLLTLVHRRTRPRNIRPRPPQTSRSGSIQINRPRPPLRSGTGGCCTVGNDAPGFPRQAVPDAVQGRHRRLLRGVFRVHL